MSKSLAPISCSSGGVYEPLVNATAPSALTAHLVNAPRNFIVESVVTRRRQRRWRRLVYYAANNIPARQVNDAVSWLLFRVPQNPPSTLRARKPRNSSNYLSSRAASKTGAARSRRARVAQPRVFRARNSYRVFGTTCDQRLDSILGQILPDFCQRNSTTNFYAPCLGTKILIQGDSNLPRW